MKKMYTLLAALACSVLADAQTISLSKTSLSGFRTNQNICSPSQSFSLSASSLNGNLSVTAPVSYEISLDNTSFSSVLALIPSGNTLPWTNIYVRIRSHAQAGAPSGTIRINTDAASQTLALSGEVTPLPPRPFTLNNLVVYRVGDGSAPLTNGAAKVYLDEFTPAGQLVQSIAMPSIASGSNLPFTALSTGSLEGLITRSANRQYLVLGGYDAAPGTQINVQETTRSVIGRIDANGTINTTTAIADLYGYGIRSVASDDGSRFWVATQDAGFRYTDLGNQGPSVMVSTMSDGRQVGISDEQLMVLKGSPSGSQGLYKMGDGLPTDGGNNPSLLPGTNSPVMAPASFDIQGDRLYISDLGLNNAAGGIGFFLGTPSGYGWSNYYTLHWGLSSGVFGMAVDWSNPSYRTFFATTTNNQLVRVKDDQGGGSFFTSLFTSTENTAFKGIALAPEGAAMAPLPVRFTNLKASQQSNGVQLDWSNLTETDIAGYSIERSANGRSFTSIAAQDAKRNDGGKVDYQHLDALASGDLFYRIKATEQSGQIFYSNIVRINTAKENAELVLYPNPVNRGTELNVQMGKLPAGVYSMKIFNTQGVMVSNRSWKHSGGTLTQSIPLTNLASGVYHVRVDGDVQLQKQFIVQ